MGTVICASVDAGWSSLAARRAHNPKVAGSNPAPATNFPPRFNKLRSFSVIPTAFVCLIPVYGGLMGVLLGAYFKNEMYLSNYFN